VKRAVALAFGIALALSACGSGDDPVTKAEYEQRTATIQRDLATSLQVELNTRKQRQEAAPRVAGAMREAADDADAMDPPSEIAEHHDAYVDALRRCADRFEDILGKHDDKDEAFGELLALTCVEEMQAALGDMEDKGYRVENALG
jgi:hypothetical protein